MSVRDISKSDSSYVNLIAWVKKYRNVAKWMWPIYDSYNLVNHCFFNFLLFRVISLLKFFTKLFIILSFFWHHENEITIPFILGEFVNSYFGEEKIIHSSRYLMEWNNVSKITCCFFRWKEFGRFKFNSNLIRRVGTR